MTLTVERLRDVLDYEPRTGAFTWKRCGRGIKRPEAGCVNTIGYRVIRIDKTLYLAHRLAWLHVHGQWPAKAHLDHINHETLDNRIENLREMAAAGNLQNRKGANKNSVTGVLGVSIYGEKWVARIMRNRKTEHLGVFATLEEAANVAASAKRRAIAEA